MFLDMGENIHIHYRDLRIEMSVEEFLEFHETFNRYSTGVLKEIDSGYHDGVLPNTNESTTIKTFWDKGKLKSPSKYDNNLIAIEETTDGYHIHLRNYKILLDRNSFNHLTRALTKSHYLLEDDNLNRDPFRLLQLNNLEPLLVAKSSSGDKEETQIEVQKKFHRKSGQVLSGLGYRLMHKTELTEVYEKDNSTVVLAVSGHTTLPAQDRIHAASWTISLPVFLDSFGKSLGRHDLNTLKLRILYLFNLAEKGQISPFSLEDISINRQTLTPSLDIFSQKSARIPLKEYQRFNEILVKNGIFFIKPVKTPFPAALKEELFEKFIARVAEHIAPHRCVSKIFISGSAINGHSGKYQVPFVHFNWCKLASDFDILVEIDPDYEEEIPKEWDFKFSWPKHSAEYFHLGDIGSGMKSKYAKQYPGIVFYEHLLESYFFFPSKVTPKIKEAYYERIKPILIHKKENIVSWVETQYGLETVNMKPYGAMSFNKIYRVDVKGNVFALKIYDNKYISNNDPSRIEYEIDVLKVLADSDLPVALPVPNTRGEYILAKGQDKAVLFHFISGRFIGKANEDQARVAGNLLGRLHTFLQNHSNSYQQKIDIRRPMFLWLDAHEKYQADGTIKEGVGISKYVENIKGLNTFATHCHGDVSPRNFLFENTTCSMIDFQNLGFGPAVIDLTDGMAEFASQGRLFKWDVLKAFQEGYEGVRKLSSQERSCLDDLLISQLLIKQVRLYRNHLTYGLELKKDKIDGLNEALHTLL